MVFTSRILGLDFGEKRIGVSISDPLRITAQPLSTIQYYSEQNLWEKFDQFWIKYDIEKVVVGLPLNMNGSFGPSAERAKNFGENLKSRFQIGVEFWDERLTSSEAKKTIQQFGKKPSKRKEQIDKLASILILQGYLDSKNFNKQINE
jgi:putative holliday junction resolvase